MMSRNSLSDTVSPEDVREHCDSITDFSDSLHVSSNAEEMDMLSLIHENQFAAQNQIESKVEPSKNLTLLNITHGNDVVSQWTFDMQANSNRICRGLPSGNRTPISTLTIEEDDLIELMKGEENLQKLFLSGILKMACDGFMKWMKGEETLLKRFLRIIFKMAGVPSPLQNIILNMVFPKSKL